MAAQPNLKLTNPALPSAPHKALSPVLAAFQHARGGFAESVVSSSVD